MPARKQLALRAVAEATKLRARLGVPPGATVDIYDLAEKVGLDVRFAAIPSMEGIYHADARPRPTIVISSLRPPGRRASTCGHELGHHVFGHGSRLEELVEGPGWSGGFDPDEYLVDVFSAATQMPKLAVLRQAAARSIDLRTCGPEDAFALSTVFGASYGGFLNHAASTLKLIDQHRAAELARHRPKCLRQRILGRSCPGHLHIVDEHWRDRPIDVEVGDAVLLPAGAELEGSQAVLFDEIGGRPVLSAESPGLCQVTAPEDWAAFVRISRRGYEGLAAFRFDEETADDD